MCGTGTGVVIVKVAGPVFHCLVRDLGSKAVLPEDSLRNVGCP